LPDALIAENIHKRYGTGKPVISEFSHRFLPESITALVGPNGSGKTTLSRMLCVLSFPTSGRVLYGDLDVHQHPYQYLRHVGVVDDASELPHYLSAVELLEWIARERGTMAELGEAGISALLDRVRLDERRNELIGTYSSGMIKKAQMAAALTAKPRVLILDEPFRGLDSESFEAAVGIVTNFAARGGIVVLSTHRKEVVDSVATTVIEMPEATVRTPLAAGPRE
jgi:ABC-type multidrug transport system ATPase subunit